MATFRLVLRPFTEGDVDALHQIYAEKDVLRYFPRTDPRPREEVCEQVLGQIAHWDEHGYGWWAVEPRSERKLIGWSGLQYLPDTDEIEVAYCLAKPFWGKGMATEAARAGLRFGFEELGLDSIVAIVHPDNAASIRVIEKLGMSFVDRSRYFGMDCLRYRIERQVNESGTPGCCCRK